MPSRDLIINCCVPGDLYYLNSVSDVHLQKGIEKDEKRMEDIQRNTSKIKMELEQARKGFLTAAPGADGVTGQELAGGGEEDHQPARGGLGMDSGRGQAWRGYEQEEEGEDQDGEAGGQCGLGENCKQS